MMQKHDDRARPLCGTCNEVIGHRQLYLVVHQRDDVDTDATAMVHLDHFRSTTCFGMVTSRLRLALDDVRFLREHNIGYPEQMDQTLADIARAIERLEIEHRQAAQTLGFTSRGGIGPDDRRSK